MIAIIHNFQAEAYERRLAAANEIMCEQNRVVAKLYAALRIAQTELLSRGIAVHPRIVAALNAVEWGDLEAERKIEIIKAVMADG